MKIIEPTPTRRDFGLVDVSECNNVNEVLEKLNVGDYVAEPIPEVCDGYQVIKDDFGHPVSIVSETYDLLQPLETFAFMDSLKEYAGFSYSRAGFTHNGTRLQIEANCGDIIVGEKKVGDIINKRLVARTSFDGSISTNLSEELYRLWCSNGCGNWIDGEIKIKARHSKNQRNILTDHINQATGITNIFMRLEEDIQVLRKRKVSEKQAERVIKGFFPNDTTRSECQRVEVLNEFHNEDRGTFGRNAYDLINAFTAHRCHIQGSREGKRVSKEENKFHSVYNVPFIKKVRNHISLELGV